MNYCEKCKIVEYNEYCSVCGRKNREVSDDDFCFLVKASESFGEMFEDVLRRESIPCAIVPCGTGVSSALALKLESCRIYVPFRFLQKAVELLNDFGSYFDDEMHETLKANFDKLHINPKVEKKPSKRLKLPQDTSVTDFCKVKLLNAQSFSDNGSITGCPHDGRYLLVYTSQELIMLNSVTFEILSVRKRGE